MNFKRLIISTVVVFFLSFGSIFASSNSSKNEYFTSTDRIYSELYDNKIISESIWKALLNQTHFLIYSSNVNPKSVYISALSFGSDILGDQIVSIHDKITSIKDGYYSLTKEVYYNLYKTKYITYDEYKTRYNEAWDNIYNVHSTPKKIYNSALEYKKNALRKGKL